MPSVLTEREILPALAQRLLIADAIHEGVCEATETDGSLLCAIYAAVTLGVMTRLTGERHVLQAGMISIRLSENYRARCPSGATHFTMDGRAPTPGGRTRAADPLPEFHAWCGRIHEPRDEDEAEANPASLCEFIDISARHYPTLVQAIDGDWPGPGDFAGRVLWTTGDRIPDGVILIPDRDTTFAIMERVTAEPLLAKIKLAAGLATTRLRSRGLASL